MLNTRFDTFFHGADCLTTVFIDCDRLAFILNGAKSAGTVPAVF
jgi:hypothetical protein